MKTKVSVCVAVLFSLSLPAHAQFNGVPFGDDGAVCRQQTFDISPAQRTVIARTMGFHSARLYHWLWHSTRNGWKQLNSREQQLVQMISPAWGQNAPLCPAGQPPGSNAAGEEFLRMHHLMIDYVRQRLAEASLPCIAAWPAAPDSKDSVWPVPQGAADDSSKSQEMGRVIDAWSTKFMSREFLTTHSLSQVGYLIEFSMHNMMHMRFANQARPGDDYSPLAAGQNSIDALMAPTVFDQPNYNYLGNPYSSAVNPVFWKLHGWVDGVAVAWLRANGYVGIKDDCGGAPGCYQWQSQWVGGMTAGHDHTSAGSATGGGAPRGGSGPSESRSMGPEFSSAISKLEGVASFRNLEFERSFSTPRGGGSPPVGGAGPGNSSAGSDIDDPEVFVQRFGPCPRLPSFLR